MSLSLYKDGGTYVAVETGMPEHPVKLGLGTTPKEAIESLEMTPLQSAGRPGEAERDAIGWAQGQGWQISDYDELEDADDEMPEDPITAAVREVDEAATASMEAWTGWEWTHDSGGVVAEGPGPQDDWDVWETARATKLAKAADLEEGQNPKDVAAAEREYGEECQDDAETAAAHAEECVELATQGKWASALEAAEAAERLERAYGDSPAYRRLVAVCRRGLEIHRGQS